MSALLWLTSSSGLTNSGQAIVPFAPSLSTSGTQSFPEATVTVGVAIPASFPASGLLTIAGVTGNVTYTGISGSTFTGCSGGTGTNIAGGASVRLNGMNLVNRPQQIEDAIGWGQYALLPPPWPPFQSGGPTDPSIEVLITNGANSAPIAPILVDTFADPIGGVFSVSGFAANTIFHPFAEFATVQPGQTLNGIVSGLPVTQMLLVLMYLSIDPSWQSADVTSGWTATVNAWRS